MSAPISWVCKADHPLHEQKAYPPVLTINEGAWAFCPQGANDEHRWYFVEPTAIERLRYLRGTFHEMSASALKVDSRRAAR